jgi:hypothetical protein
MKFKFSRQDFEVCWNIKFHENPFHEDGRTAGRHDEAHSRFSQLYERD